MIQSSVGIRRNIPIVVTPRINAILHRVFSFFAWAAQREPQHAAHQHSAKHNRGEGHKTLFAHIHSFVIQMLTPEGARHV